MISYQPFYEALYEKGLTEYDLTFKQGISTNTLHRIRHGEAINTKAINTFCEILNCKVEDIIEYIPED